MEEQKFKVIIVEDVKLELKGTEEIFRHEIPNAEVIGTAMTESEFWPLMEAQLPDLVLLDLGLGGSTTIGVDICRNIFKRYKGVRVLIFTGEILNEKLYHAVVCRLFVKLCLSFEQTFVVSFVRFAHLWDCGIVIGIAALYH